MAPTRTIACEECGHPYETQRSNTKYCALCRLEKNLRFIGSRTTDCWLCSKEFAPLERGEDSCGDCCYESQKPGVTECVYCHETRPRVRDDVSVCHACARDPQHRRKFIRAVADKKRQRLVAKEAA